SGCEAITSAVWNTGGDPHHGSPVASVGRGNLSELSGMLGAHSRSRRRPMAEKTILVCDVCGQPATHTVTILIGGRRLLKDYCDAHASELRSGARAAGRSRRAPVASKGAKKGRA